MSNGHFSADSPQKSVSSRRIVTVAVICVLVLALAAVGFFLVRPALDPYHCRMADGVSIAGVDVGGMTKGEARKALQAALDETLYRENLTVALPMKSITLPRRHWRSGGRPRRRERCLPHGSFRRLSPRQHGFASLSERKLRIYPHRAGGLCQQV